MKQKWLLPITVLWAVTTLPQQAWAGGLYLTDRGSRALGRGGSFVAGTDDGQSLWYNPAGLAFTEGRQLHIDGTLPIFRATFQRVTNDRVNGNPPSVDADVAFLPVPTIAYSDNFGLKDWSFGAAVMTPNAVMLGWPETVGRSPEGRSIPGPTRYSLISMKGSAIANIALGAAWQPVKGLSFGLGLHVIPARLRAGVYLSACDYGLLCKHPEDPDYEAPAIVDLKRAVTATGIAGFIYVARLVSVGASVMLPYTIGGTAELEVNLPNAPVFGRGEECRTPEGRAGNPGCAQVEGNKADVGLDFPLVARLGAELRPTRSIRFETGIVYEGWSRQKDFTLEPRGIKITNAVGIPNYEVGPVSVPRQMQDVFSLRFGGEYQPVILPVTVRAGLIWENSAFPTKTLTPMTLDSDKLVMALGGTYELSDDLKLDWVYAHIFMKNVQVRDSVVYPQNPLRPPRPPPDQDDPQPEVGEPKAVGNGNYTMEADLIGAGLRWNF